MTTPVFAYDRTRLLIVLLALAVSLSVVCELAAGPCLYFYRWPESDANFWDVWAISISRNDWLNEKAPHPYTSWQARLADEVLALSRPDLTPEQLKSGEPQRALWKVWYKPKEFHQEPLYVYMVAATYAITGPRPWCVFAWQILLGAISVYLVFDMAERHFGRNAAILSGLMTALCPLLVFFQVQLLRETLLVFATLMAVRVAEWALERDTVKAYAVTGIVCGLATLAKATFAIYPLLASVMLAWRLRKALRQFAARLAAGLLGMLLATAPLMARNAFVGAPLTSLASQQSVSITASCVDYNRTGGALSVHSARILYESGGRFLPAMKLTLATHPGWSSVLCMFIDKFRLIWHWREIPDNASLGYFQLHSSVLRYLPAIWGLLAPIGLAGAILAITRKRSNVPPLWPLLLMLFCLVFPMVLFATNSRYRAPLAALLAPFAGHFLVTAAEWIKEMRWRPMLASAVSVALFFVWLSDIPQAYPIRPADYIVPVQFYYWPEYQQALSVGNFSQARQTLDTLLQTEPDWIHHLGPDRMPRSDYERTLAHVFCEVRGWQVQALERAGLHEQAAAAKAALAKMVTALERSDTELLR